MAQEFAKKFYQGKQWKNCRQAYISKRMLVDGGLCEECHKEQGYIVHHKKMLTENNINDVTITLNLDNLAYVCKECHDKFDGHGVHKKKNRIKSRCWFDENGNVHVND